MELDFLPRALAGIRLNLVNRCDDRFARPVGERPFIGAASGSSSNWKILTRIGEAPAPFFVDSYLFRLPTLSLRASVTRVDEIRGRRLRIGVVP